MRENIEMILTVFLEIRTTAEERNVIDFLGFSVNPLSAESQSTIRQVAVSCFREYMADLCCPVFSLTTCKPSEINHAYFAINLNMFVTWSRFGRGIVEFKSQTLTRNTMRPLYSRSE